jgi:predicted metalloprotease with PDZ domain
VDWQSPAWDAGLRSRQAILLVNGNKIDAQAFNELLASLSNGDKIKLLFTTGSGQKEEEVTLRKKIESSFSISPIANPGALQERILKSWLGEK